MATVRPTRDARTPEETFLVRRQAQLVTQRRQELATLGVAPPPAPALPPEPTAEEEARRASGLAQAPGTQILGGIRDAVVETGRTILDLGDWLDQTLLAPEEYAKLPRQSVRAQAITAEARAAIEATKVPPPEALPEGLARSAAQFVTAFAPATRVLKGIGLARGVTPAAGAVADFSAFDPRDPRVSNLIHDLAPELRTPITEYLAAHPDDTEAEGRLKNALEGLGIGAALDGVILVARSLRAVQAAGGAKNLAHAQGAVETVETPRVTAAAPVPGGAPTLDVIEDPAEVLRRGPTGEGVPEPPPTGPFTEPLPGTAPEPRRPGAEPAANEPARRPLLRVTPATPDEVEKFLGIPADDLVIDGKTVEFNWQHVKDPDDVKRLWARALRTFRERIAEERRGVVSNEETEKVANALGMTLEDLLARRNGQAYNAAESTAARMVAASYTREFKALMARVAAGDPEAKAALPQAMGLLREVSAQVMGIRSEAGRATQSWAIDVDGSMALLTKIGDLVEEVPTGLPAETFATMVLNLDEPAKIHRFARLAEVAAAHGEGLMEVYFGSLLSSPQTHVVNAISGPANMGRAVAERQLAGGVRAAARLLPWVDDVAPGVEVGEAWQLLMGMLGSWHDALRVGWKTARGELRPLLGDTPEAIAAATTKLDEPRPPRITAERQLGFTAEQAAEADDEYATVMALTVDWLGTAVRSPMSGLHVMDEMNKLILKRGEQRALVYRSLYGAGLRGDDLARAMQAAMDEGAFAKQAEAFSLRRAYQAELGPRGKALQFALSHPLGRLAVPFIKTPTNIFKEEFGRVPVLGAALADVRQDFMEGGAKRDLVVAQMMGGALTMATGAWLAQQGLITGGGPKDVNLRRELRETGWQPYSILNPLNGTYYSYNRFDTGGMQLGLIADWAEVAGHLDESSREELALALVLSGVKVMSSKTYTKGIAEAVNVLAEPERYGESYFRNLGRTLAPAGVAALEREVDPLLRDARTLMDVAKSRIPGQSEELPPLLNLYGEELYLSGGVGPDIMSPVWTSQKKTAPVSEEIVRLGLSISLPARSIQGVPLTPQEYHAYGKLAGGHGLKNNDGTPVDYTLKDRLLRVIGGTDTVNIGGEAKRYADLSDGPNGEKAEVIRAVVRQYRRQAQQQFLAEHEDIARLVESLRLRSDE